MAIAIEIKSDVGALFCATSSLQLSVGFVLLIIFLIPMSGNFHFRLKCVPIIPPNLRLVFFVESKLVNFRYLMHYRIELDVTHNFI